MATKPKGRAAKPKRHPAARKPANRPPGVPPGFQPGGPNIPARPASHRKAKPASHTKAKAKPKPKRAASGLIVADWWIAGRNDDEPSCVATAIANSLLACTGIRATDEQVMKLHRHAGGGDGVSISDALASVMTSGLAGVRPAGCWETRSVLEASIVGMSDGKDDHAVTQTPSGLLISWGAPLDEELADGWWMDGELWHIDWRGEGN